MQFTVDFQPKMNSCDFVSLDGNLEIAESEDRTVRLVFSGTIFNLQSLIGDLKASDGILWGAASSAVVLQGLYRDGTSFLNKIDGPFVAVWYDSVKNSLSIARDFLGQKQIYYYQNQESVLVSTSLKNLYSRSDVPTGLSKSALSQYFMLSYIPAPNTIIDNVFKLMPASVLTFNQDLSTSEEKYWVLPYSTDSLITDYNQCKAILRDTLFASVEARIKACSEVGALLSGGIDSTVIAGIASKISSKPINTFTVGFGEKSFDESNLAQIVAEKNNTKHHNIQLSWDVAKQNIKEIVDGLEEPYADSSLIAACTVSKLAKEYVPFVLSGDGGDELFAGYDKYLIGYYSDMYKKVPGFIRNGMIKPLVGMLPKQSGLYRKTNKVVSLADKDVFEQRKSLMCLAFKEGEEQQLFADGFVDDMPQIRTCYNVLNGADEQIRAQFVDLNVVLEGDMLPKGQHSNLLTGLDVVAPLFNRDVVELAYKIPTQFKINRNNKKIVLKETFADLIPEELLHAPKHGFGVPIGLWIEDELKDSMKEFADRDFIEAQGIFNYAYINSILTEHLNHSKNRSAELWAYYVFQNWWKRVNG